VQARLYVLPTLSEAGDRFDVLSGADSSALQIGQHQITVKVVCVLTGSGRSTRPWLTHFAVGSPLKPKLCSSSIMKHPSSHLQERPIVPVLANIDLLVCGGANKVSFLCHLRLQTVGTRHFAWLVDCKEYVCGGDGCLDPKIHARRFWARYESRPVRFPCCSQTVAQDRPLFVQCGNPAGVRELREFTKNALEACLHNRPCGRAPGAGPFLLRLGSRA
jgi:hypothetical protein